jgi:RNA polymerase sigma-70 factor (ECF subfamily)
MSDGDRNPKAQVLALPVGDGGGASLSALYLRYRQDVIDFVRGKFGPGPPEPEDVAQAVFLQFAAQGQAEAVRNPRSFLLKSAQNLVLDHRRHAARREKIFPQPVSELDVERVVAGQERLNMLIDALSCMPPQKRQIVLLSRVHGWSCERIAGRFGMSAEAVQKQIERILKDFLSRLGT